MAYPQDPDTETYRGKVEEMQNSRSGYILPFAILAVLLVGGIFLAASVTTDNQSVTENTTEQTTPAPTPSPAPSPSATPTPTTPTPSTPPATPSTPN